MLEKGFKYASITNIWHQKIYSKMFRNYGMLDKIRKFEQNERALPTVQIEKI